MNFRLNARYCTQTIYCNETYFHSILVGLSTLGGTICNRIILCSSAMHTFQRKLIRYSTECLCWNWTISTHHRLTAASHESNNKANQNATLATIKCYLSRRCTSSMCVECVNKRLQSQLLQSLNVNPGFMLAPGIIIIIESIYAHTPHNAQECTEIYLYWGLCVYLNSMDAFINIAVSIIRACRASLADWQTDSSIVREFFPEIQRINLW